MGPDSYLKLPDMCPTVDGDDVIASFMQQVWCEAALAISHKAMQVYLSLAGCSLWKYYQGMQRRLKACCNIVQG